MYAVAAKGMKKMRLMRGYPLHFIRILLFSALLYFMGLRMDCA